MNGRTVWTVSIGSDLAVVGHNPEAADMSNPRGEIVRERFFMRAYNDYGSAYRWGWFETPEELEAAYLAFAPPIALWDQTYPVYGSPAYEDYGEWEMRQWEMEADGVRP
jgi:hypothetical protein